MDISNGVEFRLASQVDDCEWDDLEEEFFQLMAQPAVIFIARLLKSMDGSPMGLSYDGVHGWELSVLYQDVIIYLNVIELGSFQVRIHSSNSFLGMLFRKPRPQLVEFLRRLAEALEKHPEVTAIRWSKDL